MDWPQGPKKEGVSGPCAVSGFSSVVTARREQTGDVRDGQVQYFNPLNAAAKVG